MTHGLHRWRRLTQWLFAAAFLGLLTLTVWPLGRVFFGAFLVGDPLIAMNSAVNGVWKWQMWLAVVMLALAALLGRVFCGWACPLGLVIELTGGDSRHPSRLSPTWRARLKGAPVLVLFGIAGFLLFASGAFLAFDPLSNLTRTATVTLYPALDRLTTLLGDLAYLVPALQPAVDAATSALEGRIVFQHPLVYGLQLGVLGLFAGVLALSWLEPRLWCRSLCPLGALLGQAGRLAPVGRMIDTEACISCGKCAQVCPMDAVSEDFHATDTTRCQLGLECAEECPVDAISVGLRPTRVTYWPQRRAVVVTGLSTFAAGFFGYVGLGRRSRDPRLVRPPGAQAERDFLALCARCGQCMKVCPTNVLQPGLVTTGVLGMFTPVMDYRVGDCNWSCNECGKVCPSGAILPLELDVKRETKIGRAYIDRNRCIPWADGETCLVCQELCPVPDKAIVIKTAEVTTPKGEKIELGRPEVIAEKCIGCGVCQFNCPVPHESAIVVRALGPDRLDR